eukprot:GHUV01028975.1.p1 GENE.GHUV01028975.1~~GHUV01028975.1.p1  ORF type:complete len:138 (-),score=37.01 GHUV01028975.1:660-1073(-)
MCPIRLTRAHLASPCYRSSSNRSAVSLRCRHLALPALLLAAVCLCCTCGLTGRIRIFCVQVCVQGIPWKYTWKELKELLAECGEVDRADVMTAPDGRSKGWGTVRFNTKEAANAAIEQFHGSQLEGRTLTVFLDKKA